MRYPIALACLFAAVAVPFAGGPAWSADDPQQSAAATMSKDNYLQRAAISDRFEVESSRLALAKAQSEPVKAFARQMVNDHSKTTEELKQITDTGDLPPQASLDAEHMKMIEQLTSATGAAFDKLYLDLQVKGHQQALQLHRAYASQGDNPTLKAFATKAAPLVEGHLAHVRKLARAQGGS